MPYKWHHVRSFLVMAGRQSHHVTGLSNKKEGSSYDAMVGYPPRGCDACGVVWVRCRIIQPYPIAIRVGYRDVRGDIYIVCPNAPV